MIAPIKHLKEVFKSQSILSFESALIAPINFRFADVRTWSACLLVILFQSSLSKIVGDGSCSKKLQTKAQGELSCNA